MGAGSTLSADKKAEIASRLHNYTGLPADYIERADLRVNGGEFEKNLLGSDITTGRLDTRFAGPTIDPMSKEADYDPQSAAISSAYVSVFNDYVRTTLKFGDKRTFKPELDVGKFWDMLHQPPGSSTKVAGPGQCDAGPRRGDEAESQSQGATERGFTMTSPHPTLRPCTNCTIFPIQSALQGNIEMHFYTSGHMVYAHEPDLKALHANVAAFIEKTRNSAGK